MMIGLMIEENKWIFLCQSGSASDINCALKYLILISSEK